MSFRRLIVVALPLIVLLLSTGSTLQARAKWISVSTAHFEMYTDGSEKQALKALQTFEQVRYFFLRNSKHSASLEGKVRILAFSSEKEYAPYRASAGAFAYYQPSHERDYIVMQDLLPEHHRVAVHEYTHLIINHLQLNLPLWLNEGLAEFYSSLEPDGAKAMVGRALAERLPTLLNRTPMDWNVLFAVDHQSPYYNQPDKMELFYAQSWAVTHMLEMSPAYAPNFARFLAAISAGTSTPEALQTVYAKSVAQIAAEVQKYIHQATLRAAVYDVTLSKTESDTDITDLADFDRDLSLADLLSTRPETAAEARRRLLALEQQHPESVQLQTSLAYLAWQQNNLENARKHFHSAVSHGLNAPKPLFDYAQLLQGTGMPGLMSDLLSRVIAAQPDNFDARWLLAITAANADRYGQAVSALAGVRNVPAEKAFDVFALLATVRANLKDYAGAKTELQRALSYAKTDSQRQQMEPLRTFLNTPNLPAAGSTAVNSPMPEAPHTHAELVLAADVNLPRVKGTAQSFECIDSGFRLHVQVGTHEMVFAMPEDPRDILVRNAGKRVVEFTCGALTPDAVTVVFKPASEAHVDGTIAELVY